MLPRVFCKGSNACRAQLRRFNTVPQLPHCSITPAAYEDADYTLVQTSRTIPSESPLYKTPLLIHEGHGQWLWDHRGCRYLDMFGGVVTVSVGHSHPKVVDAATRQMSKLSHTTPIYLNPRHHEYVEKLRKKLPAYLDTIYFVNSGSEANELAILLSRLYTNAQEIVSLCNGYHGGTLATASATASVKYRYSLPQQPGFIQVMYPDVYRGPWGSPECRDSPLNRAGSCSCSEDECLAAGQYFNQLENNLNHSLAKFRGIAAFICESIQGVGGVVQYPRTYLRKVYDFVRSKGGLCIADEVQAGVGRTGDHFWGFEGHGVLPDIVTAAKGIGNGFPMGFVATSRKIAAVLDSAARFNTFGGNPVACAIGSAVLDVIDEENLQENSKIIGTHFLHRLSTLALDFPTIIGDVRGKGLMIGVELISNSETKEPMPHEAVLEIFEDIKDMGVLMGKSGYHGNVLRIKPPMCITKEDADFTVEVMKTALEKYRDKNLIDKESVYFAGV